MARPPSTPHTRHSFLRRRHLRQYMAFAVPCCAALVTASMSNASVTSDTTTPSHGTERHGTEYQRLLGQVPPSADLDPTVMDVEQRIARDFDGDGDDDLLLLLIEPLPTGPQTQTTRRRRLAVMGLRDGAGFTSVQQSACLSLATDEGGMMGDPGGRVTPRGHDSAVFDNYGGSAWRWNLRFTVAWRQGAFRVVGMDTESFHASHAPSESSQTSINLLTGQYRATPSGPLKHHGFRPPRVEDCAALEDMIGQRLP